MKYVYRALLHLYPSQFRDEYSREMAADFDDASDEAFIERGWRGVLSVWLQTGADLACSIPIQWLRTGRPLLILVSAAWSTLTFALVADQFVPLQRTFLSIPPGTPGESLVLVLLTLAAVPVLAAVVRSRFGSRQMRRNRIF
jgi:hypothetical protein